MARSSRSPSRTRGAFVLLEVTVSLVILGIALVALIRAFTVSLHSVRENYVTSQATMLAGFLMEDFELEPPEEGSLEGTFEEDPRFGEDFRSYSWKAEVEDREPRYHGVPRAKGLKQELETLKTITLEVDYDDGQNRKLVPIHFTTYILEPTIYSDQAMQGCQLF